MSDDCSREFDCVQCGRHIISFGNQALQATHPDTCAACWSIPGWFNDPEVAAMLDPDNTRRPRRDKWCPAINAPCPHPQLCGLAIGSTDPRADQLCGNEAQQQPHHAGCEIMEKLSDHCTCGADR